MANLVSEVLRHGIYTRIVGKHIQYHEKIDSTMDEGRRLAIEGTDNGTLIVAENQPVSYTHLTLPTKRIE